MAFPIEFSDFIGTGFLHAASADELNDASQLVFIKPRAVRLADIDDHVRAVREVYPVHQVVALWAGQVADILLQLCILSDRRRHSEDRGLLFSFLTDFCQRSHIGPNAFAFLAFQQDSRSNGDALHIDLASRAQMRSKICHFRAVGFGAAM